MISYECKPLGIFGANCYIVSTPEGSMIIDPGAAVPAQYIPADLKAIVLTHGHFDHIVGVDALRSIAKVPVYIHEADAPLLGDAILNLSSIMGGMRAAVAPADILLKDGDSVLGFRIIHTPGHSYGSIALYHEEAKLLFSGDTLFCESYGRYDFGDYRMLLSSLNRLLALPEDTVVCPGHDKPTTIGHERKNNPAATGSR